MVRPGRVQGRPVVPEPGPRPGMRARGRRGALPRPGHRLRPLPAVGPGLGLRGPRRRGDGHLLVPGRPELQTRRGRAAAGHGGDARTQRRGTGLGADVGRNGPGTRPAEGRQVLAGRPRSRGRRWRWHAGRVRPGAGQIRPGQAGRQGVQGDPDGLRGHGPGREAAEPRRLDSAPERHPGGHHRDRPVDPAATVAPGVAGRRPRPAARRRGRGRGPVLHPRHGPGRLAVGGRPGAARRRAEAGRHRLGDAARGRVPHPGDVRGRDGGLRRLPAHLRGS